MANGITPFTPLRTCSSCYLYLLTPPKLLQAARKVTDSGRTGWPAKFGDVIAHATDGRVTLERLKSLTDADAPVLEEALKKLAA